MKSKLDYRNEKLISRRKNTRRLIHLFEEPTIHKIAEKTFKADTEHTEYLADLIVQFRVLRQMTNDINDIKIMLTNGKLKHILTKKQIRKLKIFIKTDTYLKYLWIRKVYKRTGQKRGIVKSLDIAIYRKRRDKFEDDMQDILDSLRYYLNGKLEPRRVKHVLNFIKHNYIGNDIYIGNFVSNFMIKKKEKAD